MCYWHCRPTSSPYYHLDINQCYIFPVPGALFLMEQGVCACRPDWACTVKHQLFMEGYLLTQWQATFAGVCFCSYPCQGNTRGNRSTTAKESVVTVAQPLTDLEDRAVAGPLTLWSDLTISKHAFVCVRVRVNVCVEANVLLCTMVHMLDI